MSPERVRIVVMVLVIMRSHNLWDFLIVPTRGLGREN